MGISATGHNITGDDKMVVHAWSFALQSFADTFKLINGRKNRVTVSVGVSEYNLSPPGIIWVGGQPGVGIPVTGPLVPLFTIAQVTRRFLREDYHELIDGEVWFEQFGVEGRTVTIVEIECICGLPVY